MPDGIERGDCEMRRKWLLFLILCVFVVPMHSIAQTDDPYFNAGYLIGSAIRQGVDNYRSRQAEQERIEREREEADRAYRLEQQRIANERYAAEQAAREREAEVKRAEEERLRIAEEARKAEEERIRIAEEAEAERLRLAREAESAKMAENAVIENREYNNNVQILSSKNSVKFLTDEGETIYLHVMFHGMDEGSYLSFSNRSNKSIRLFGVAGKQE